MEPTLVIVAGPMTGMVVPIASGDFRIGRDPTNGLVLPDSAVAACHCVIRRNGAHLVLRAVGGRDETFVNSLPVTEHTLADSDEIRVGQSVLEVRIRHDSADPIGGPLSTRETAAVRVVTTLRPEDVLSARAKTDEDVADTSSVLDPLVLLRVNAAVSTVRGLAGLERPLLELILEAVPARRAALLFNDDEDQLRIVAAVEQGVGTNPHLSFDETVIRQVQQQAVTIVATAEAGRSGAAARWLLATPLLAFDRVLGVIWLETTGDRFTREQALLLSAIASTAAVALDYAQQRDRLEEEARRLRAAITVTHDMVGGSRVMRDLYARIGRVARADSTVLIRGESGTGKELAARAIHRNSARADKPFVAINCAAITETLLESELFGHEKGAFTGAVAQKRGRLELAEGGTVLLDEIGELPLALQAKLLRVLDEHAVERVGGTRRVSLDFRLVAATNRDLDAAIKTGGFREDLYYRLNVVSLSMPPLRERREDIPLLARYFAQKHGQALGRRDVDISAEAMTVLTSYDWPGNVRELANAIERAMVLGGEQILSEDLSEAILDAAAPGNGAAIGRFHASVRERKKELILGAIDQADGNIAAAARLLGLHPNYLHRLMTTLQLRSPSRR